MDTVCLLLFFGRFPVCVVVNWRGYGRMIPKGEFDMNDKNTGFSEKLRKAFANGTIYCLVAILYYIAAILSGANGQRTVWLAMGAMFLCFGMRNGRKTREADKGNENAE